MAILVIAEHDNKQLKTGTTNDDRRRDQTRR